VGIQISGGKKAKKSVSWGRNLLEIENRETLVAGWRF
jgi:hypothetical protein